MTYPDLHWDYFKLSTITMSLYMTHQDLHYQTTWSYLPLHCFSMWLTSELFEVIYFSTVSASNIPSSSLPVLIFYLIFVTSHHHTVIWLAILYFTVSLLKQNSFFSPTSHFYQSFKRSLSNSTCHAFDLILYLSLQYLLHPIPIICFTIHLFFYFNPLNPHNIICLAKLSAAWLTNSSVVFRHS